MPMYITGAPKATWGRPPVVGPARHRNVAIVGSHADSIKFAPYGDPTWEIWVHSSTALLIPQGRADRLFDIHPPHCFRVARKNGFADYYQYLKDSKVPVYMSETYPEIPQAVRYPVETITDLWPEEPIKSQTAFMIALALYEGVTTLGLWGVHYEHRSDLEESRANCEMWIGIAKGMGVRVKIAKQSPLCRKNPGELYGYETHATLEQYEARVKAFREACRDMDGIAPTGPVEACETTEAEARAREIRMQNPGYREAFAKVTQSEEIPEWFRAEEDLVRACMGLPPLDGYVRTPTGLVRQDAEATHV
jgi:hypothetical protein